MHLEGLVVCDQLRILGGLLVGRPGEYLRKSVRRQKTLTQDRFDKRRAPDSKPDVLPKLGG